MEDDVHLWTLYRVYRVINKVNSFTEETFVRLLPKVWVGLHKNKTVNVASEIPDHFTNSTRTIRVYRLRSSLIPRLYPRTQTNCNIAIGLGKAWERGQPRSSKSPSSTHTILQAPLWGPLLIPAYTSAIHTTKVSTCEAEQSNDSDTKFLMSALGTLHLTQV